MSANKKTSPSHPNQCASIGQRTKISTRTPNIRRHAPQRVVHERRFAIYANYSSNLFSAPIAHRSITHRPRFGLFVAIPVELPTTWNISRDVVEAPSACRTHIPRRGRVL